MRPNLSGNIIFVFSDPGGAKPCLSIIEENNLSNVIAVSNRYFTFFSNFKTKVILQNDNFEQLIAINKPELIFTGTSYTTDIEKQFIKIAKKNNITCYTFVDHWTNISSRFKDTNGKMILPDKIWVIDNRAKQIALQEGISENLIYISGNPYHKWLKKWIPSISKKCYLSQIGIKAINKKILVYAPDPLSNINGIEKYGFDEITATSSLVDLCTSHLNELKDWIFLVKLHSNQDIKKIRMLISDNIFFHIIPDEVDANTTIYYADVVMGFFSSFLIEAAIINVPVLRYLDKPILNDPINELNIGIKVNKDTLLPTLLEKKY